MIEKLFPKGAYVSFYTILYTNPTSLSNWILIHLSFFSMFFWEVSFNDLINNGKESHIKWNRKSLYDSKREKWYFWRAQKISKTISNKF